MQNRWCRVASIIFKYDGVLQSPDTHTRPSKREFTIQRIERLKRIAKSADLDLDFKNRGGTCHFSLKDYQSGGAE